MFGLGMPEILLILAIALIVIGPQKLPEVAKTLGRAMGEFKRSAQDLKNSIDIDTTPVKKEVTSRSKKKKLKDVIKDIASDDPVTESESAQSGSSEDSTVNQEEQSGQASSPTHPPDVADASQSSDPESTLDSTTNDSATDPAPESSKLESSKPESSKA